MLTGSISTSICKPCKYFHTLKTMEAGHPKIGKETESNADITLAKNKGHRQCSGPTKTCNKMDIYVEDKCRKMQMRKF